jgi:hypothetical protein
LIVIFCFPLLFFACFCFFCCFVFFFHIWQIATLVVYNLRWCLTAQCLCIYTKIAKLHDNNVCFFL